MAQVLDSPLGEEADDGDEPPRDTRGRTVMFVVGAGICAALVFPVVRQSLTDDAYITLAYARNVATELHWGLIPDALSNSATSPLNVLLLALATAGVRAVGLGVRPVLALGVVTVALTMVMAWGWTRIVLALRLPVVAAVVGVLLVLLNPFVLSAVGLEVVLVPAVLVLLVVAALERHPVWFGAVAALAVLARLDLLVFVLVIALCTVAIRRRLHVAVVTAVVVAAPWYVFSWMVLGSVVPDTLVIKTSQQGLFGQWTFLTGPVMYFLSNGLVVVVAFLPAVLGVFAVVGWLVLRWSVRWDRSTTVSELTPAAALGIGGIVYYAVYSVLGVNPYHWYFVPSLTSLAMFLVIAVGAWFTGARREERLRPAAPAFVLGLAGLLVLGNIGVGARQGVPWSTPVVFGNWASAKDYARIATALRERIGGRTVQSPGEIGTLAYYCQCAIVDEFSDRGRLLRKVNERINGDNMLISLLLRANYANLDRSTPPRPMDYRLEYASGPGSGPDTWTVHFTATGVGHFTLIPVTASSGPPAP